MVVKCPKCGKLLEVPKEKLGKKEVCEHCENVFIVEESMIYKEEKIPEKTPSEEIKKKPKKGIPTWIKIMLIIVIAIVGIRLGFLLLVKLFSPEGSSLPISLTPSWHLIKSTSQTLAIPASSYRTLTWSFPQNVKVEGEIELIEGDDISYFYVMDEENFYRFESEETFNYIEGGKALVSYPFEFTISKEGTYYFVIGNSALFQNKTVKISFRIYKYY
jgi:hypothetical protein